MRPNHTIIMLTIPWMYPHELYQFIRVGPFITQELFYLFLL